MQKTKKYLLFLLIFLLSLSTTANAKLQTPTQEWKKIIDERTAVIWADAQFLDTIVLNARGNASVTWLPRSLLKVLDKNKDAADWIITGLNFYFSNNPETNKKLKGRDVIAVNYKAVKTWSFNPTDFVFGDYKITSDDILSRPRDYTVGDMHSGTQDLVFLCVPSKIMKPNHDIKISLGVDSAVLHLPKK